MKSITWLLHVLNRELQMVGIVRHDEAFEVLRAEHTEDLEKFMGMIPGKGLLDYIRTSVWQHFKRELSGLRVLLMWVWFRV